MERKKFRLATVMILSSVFLAGTLPGFADSPYSNNPNSDPAYGQGYNSGYGSDNSSYGQGYNQNYQPPSNYQPSSNYHPSN